MRDKSNYDVKLFRQIYFLMTEFGIGSVMAIKLHKEIVDVVSNGDRAPYRGCFDSFEGEERDCLIRIIERGKLEGKYYAL